ncbi:MAG: 1-phosphofructokinase family hexose kinase [Oscillospiraceae bacterium]|nr:1-phosphofructokinase family hexose kinase [Oscillospiraceae bacterium]MDD4413993.1 1-phosphofructokinase family hexose kinase [Oscillospiraceae bacterium]
MSRSIISITLNPSIDITIWTDGLHRDKVNRVTRETREVGGKGINVSRVANSLGQQTLCIGVAGDDNYLEFSGRLEQENLRYEFVKTQGSVRENLTIRSNDQTIKINRKGPPVSAMIIGALMELIKSRVRPGDIVVFAGSLPENVDIKDYIELIIAVKNVGALIAIDSDILTVEDYRVVRPWLIKPNLHELRSIVKLKGDSIDDIIEAVYSLYEVGVENVLVSLGGDGMVHVSNDGILRVSVPKVEVKSTVGAGDSALAGYIVGFIKGRTTEDCVRLAAACGTSSVMLDGTRLTTSAAANDIADKTSIQRVEHN